MERTWRWFGKNDKITLAMLKQIGVEGIVTALHDVPLGEVWSREKIRDLREYIESYGMRWSVVESLPVTETIKYGGPDRDRQIEVYKESLANLGEEGIHCVCYNFMPVLDWARTDLLHANPNGASNLYFNWAEFAYFDIYILKREGAEAEWRTFQDEHAGWNRDIIAEAREIQKKATPAYDRELVENIVIKTQGFVSGNFKEGDERPVELFRDLLALYDGVTKDMLRQNMKTWLEAIMPVCDKYDTDMCVHPDDPPFPILGLPRIVNCDADIQWLLDAVPNVHNGLTFCAGSLSAGGHNDLTPLAQKYHDRTHFVHLRSCHIFPNGDFTEASHLGGRADLIELTRIFENEEQRRITQRESDTAANGAAADGQPAPYRRPGRALRLPMLFDHGMTMLGDDERGYNAGYSFLGRMFALGQVQGIIATVDRELGISFSQPGFYD